MPDLLDMLRTHAVIETRPSRYGRDGWFLHDREIAHMHLDGMLDLRLGKKLIKQERAKLEADPCVLLRRSATSEWLEIDPRIPGASTRLKQLLALLIQNSD